MDRFCARALSRLRFRGILPPGKGRNGGHFRLRGSPGVISGTGRALRYLRVEHPLRQATPRRRPSLPRGRDFEPFAPVPGFGLACLPEPDEGDIFLDFEGDPFVGEHGLEYLHGFHYIDGGETRYQGLWALDREVEKAAFETFIDFVIARLETYPNLHVYHYGGYEPGALKRLMGRYATREDELDRLLRGKVLVDLLSVVRHAIRAGVESYSIKKLEQLFGYERDAKLPDANQALTRLQSEWLELITPLIEQLPDGVPVDPTVRSAEEHGRWLLANLLEWHRREEKAGWWEYFRLCDLSAEDLLEERAGLSGLQYIETVGGTAKCPIDRYSFPAQEADIRPGKGIKVQGGQSVGSVEDISRSHRTIDIKKTSAMANEHPEAIFVHEHVSSKPMQESLVRCP